MGNETWVFELHYKLKNKNLYKCNLKTIIKHLIAKYNFLNKFVCKP